MKPGRHWTALMDSGRKQSWLTAYDAQTAALLVEAGVDVLLVGDSLGMVFQGRSSTLGVTLEDMVYHTRAVRRGAPEGLIVSDLPAGTYDDPGQALTSSRALIDAGADAVKLEGYAPGLAASLVQARIPVVGHLGLLPQTAPKYVVQAREAAEAEALLVQAQALEAEGICALVLECIPSSLGQRCAQTLTVPVIGIGAGPDTDGQVLVVNDLLGWGRGRRPRFVPVGEPPLADAAVARIRGWVSRVQTQSYPNEQESYH